MNPRVVRGFFAVFFLLLFIYGIGLVFSKNGEQNAESQMTADTIRHNISQEIQKGSNDQTYSDTIIQQSEEDKNTVNTTSNSDNNKSPVNNNINNTKPTKKQWRNFSEKQTVPENWNGIPISENNNLFKDQSSETINQTKTEMLDRLLSSDQFPRKKQWDDLIQEFVPVLGWNGFFEVTQTHFNMSQNSSMALASYYYLGRVAMDQADRYRYAIEICAQEILKFSHLYGAVARALEIESIYDDHDAFYDFTVSELCDFKYYPHKGYEWQTCIVGVGRHVAVKHNDSMADALKLCEKPKTNDWEWQYQCASGVYMDFVPLYGMKTFAPCGMHKFPAACFRYKKEAFNDLRDKNVTNPCKTQTSQYSYRGCLYGESYTAEFADVEIRLGNARGRCRKYELNDARSTYINDFATCLDGFYQSHPIGYYPEFAKEVECELYENNTAATQVCEYHAGLPHFKNVTYYDPTVVPRSDPLFYRKWPVYLLEEFNEPPAPNSKPPSWPTKTDQT